MRLTLRTMLAYLDEILEPDDAADIGKKIEESEFATDLVRRTRDCIRRLRLGAPPLMGKGIALDPNTVAEYLDNTLSSERVPDFEKICLESDVHLAEVAACHQVLTLVLGEPAEIDAASRERIYALAKAVGSTGATASAAAGSVPPVPSGGVEAPPVQAPPVATTVIAPPVAAPPVVNKRARPEVPDYLRESRSIFWPIAVALLILLSVAATVGGGLYFFGPPEVQRYLASLNEGGDGAGALPPLPPDGSVTPPTPAQPVLPPLDNEKPGEKPAEPAPAGPLPPLPGEPLPTTPATPGPPTAGPAPEGVAPATEPGVPAKPLEFPKPAMVKPAGDDGPPAPLPSDVPLPKPAVGEPATAGPAITPPPAVIPPLPGQGTAVPPLDAPRVASLPKPPGTEPPVGPAPEPAPAVEGLGRYLTGQDVLLRYDRNDNSWRRLPANANVFAGDFLLALPTYSPSVTLSNGVVVRPIGPVQFELQKGDANGVPGVIVDYGRVVFMTVGKGVAQVRLMLGDRPGMLTFNDGDSSAAVEVRRVLPPGQNPETGPAALAAEVYAASGQIVWEDANGETPLRAPGNKVLASIPGMATPGAIEIPKWIAGDVLIDIEKRGTRDLEQFLTFDRPVSLTLKEQSDSRRLETRSLAIRCSAYVGQFDPFVSALNDPEQRGNWNNQIDTLRSALARGPEVAAAVRATFEKQRGVEEGGELYRMLWGYSADQVPTEGFKLVRGLDHKSLDYRVLSFWNLQTMSGNSFAYKPADQPVKRAPAVMKWKERLDEGKLMTPVATPAPKTPAAPQPAPAGTP